MDEIKSLIERRARAHGEMKELVAKGADNWDAEDRQKFDKCDEDIVRFTADIDKLKRAAERDTFLAERAEEPIVVATPDGEKSITEEQHREAFEAYLRRGFSDITEEQRAIVRGNTPVEARAQSVGTDNKGGYTVPLGFHAELTEALKAFGGVRSVARGISTTNGQDIEWPTEDDTSSTGQLLAENAEETNVADITFGLKTLKAYKYSSKFIKVSLELLNDSAFELESHIRDVATRRIGRITNTHFTTGDDSSKPQGVVTFSSKGADAAAAAAIGYDDFVELEHSVDPAYRQAGGCTWMFADGTLKAAKKLKDADGHPLWVPGMATKEPDTILGYKYTINQDMSAVATGVKSVLFGDFSYYIVRDIPSFTTVLRLAERFAEFGQVGFLMFTRHDGRGVAAESTTKVIRHLLHP